METAPALRRVLGTEWMLRQKSGVTLDDSVVEPDIVVVAGPVDRFVASHPRPYAVELLIEISDRTLGFDRRKVGEYAANGIGQSWIINLIDNCVEWYQQPSGPIKLPHYGTLNLYKYGESIPVIIKGQMLGHIDVNDLLPGSQTM